MLFEVLVGVLVAMVHIAGLKPLQRRRFQHQTDMTRRLVLMAHWLGGRPGCWLEHKVFAWLFNWFLLVVGRLGLALALQGSAPFSFGAFPTAMPMQVWAS